MQNSYSKTSSSASFANNPIIVSFHVCYVSLLIIAEEKNSPHQQSVCWSKVIIIRIIRRQNPQGPVGEQEKYLKQDRLIENSDVSYFVLLFLLVFNCSTIDQGRVEASNVKLDFNTSGRNILE